MRKTLLEKAFMEKLFLILILAVIFVSGCVEGTALEQVFGKKQVEVPYYGLAETTNQDIVIRAEAVPTEVKTGRNMTIYFDLENPQLFDLENFNLTVYDTCLFPQTNCNWDKEPTDTIEANKTKRFKYTCELPDIDFEQDCKIKFKVEYKAKFMLSQAIAVLQQTEYYTKQQQGTLGQIAISSSSTSNPLQISLSFSDEQPFLEGEKYHMYIDYANIGNGFLEEGKVNKEDITIGVPKNLEPITVDGKVCSEVYIWNENDRKLVLDRELKFIRNKAPKSTCSFTVEAGQPIDLKSLTLTATYKYMLDNSIIVKVSPR